MNWFSSLESGGGGDCFAGIGRSTLVAASLLIRSGLALAEALELISEARLRPPS